MLAGPGVSAQQTVFNGPSADVLDGTTYAAYSFENGDSKGSATLLELGLTS